MVVVDRDGDKVSMKLYNGLRERKVGNSWFKNSRNVTFITVNTKTGDVYTGYLKNYQKKKKFTKKICKNFFGDEPINSFMLGIRDCVWSYIHNHNEVILESVSKFIYEVDGRSDSNELTYEKRLFKFYLDKKGIKYPNNFHLYSSKLIGPKIRKLLKKNDYRLVDTFMEYNNLNGKKLKQALHTCSRLNIDLYKKTKKLFGDDWINQDEDFISNTLNCEYGIGDRSIPRKDSRDSNERATIEYQLSKVGDKVKYRRIQSLGKYNGKLPETWLYYILKMDSRMSNYVNHKNFETVKITKKCSNGIELHSDSYWDEDGLIKWTHKTIDGPHTIQYQWL